MSKKWDEATEGVRFWYTNYKGEDDLRHVIPLRVTFMVSEFYPEHPDGAWFLVAYDLKKKVTRDFLFERINRVAMNPSVVPPPPIGVTRVSSDPNAFQVLREPTIKVEQLRPESFIKVSQPPATYQGPVDDFGAVYDNYLDDGTIFSD